MLILLSPAKTMRSSLPHDQSFDDVTTPRLMACTSLLVDEMRARSVDVLQRELKVSPAVAQETQQRFAAFDHEAVAPLAALDAYDGVVFKHMRAGAVLSEAQRAYLQRHARICSPLYGLLRPLDGVLPYRMEGTLRLKEQGVSVDRFWRDHQTDLLLEDARAQGGTLIYLASKQEQLAFHWRRVEQGLRVIHIDFLQRKGDKLRNVVVYTKMARGEMLRYLVAAQIEKEADLQGFEWEGYRYEAHLSTETRWVWLRE